MAKYKDRWNVNLMMIDQRKRVELICLILIAAVI